MKSKLEGMLAELMVALWTTIFTLGSFGVFIAVVKWLLKLVGVI